MTSWIISMILLAATGVGIGDRLQDRDQLQDRNPIQDQLRDGSCKTASLIAITQFNS